MSLNILEKQVKAVIIKRSWNNHDSNYDEWFRKNPNVSIVDIDIKVDKVGDESYLIIKYTDYES